METVHTLLSKTEIKKAPVVDGNKIVGIVTRSIITHYLARRYLEHMQRAGRYSVRGRVG